jgi:hypothetical protein
MKGSAPCAHFRTLLHPAAQIVCKQIDVSLSLPKIPRHKTVVRDLQENQRKIDATKTSRFPVSTLGLQGALIRYSVWTAELLI